jgi:hypothetical protein
LAAKSLGKPPAGVDPGIPEWGNPPGVMPRYLAAEHIGGREGTGGTETSQYLEEQRAFPE